MASAMWKACRVLLLVVGGVTLAMAARGGGGPGAREDTEFVLTPDHIELCDSLDKCTEWCSSCTKRIVAELDTELNDCSHWGETLTGYKYYSKCSNQAVFQVCVCTTLDVSCRMCKPSQDNDLLCFTLEDRGVHVWDKQLGNRTWSLPLEEMCSTCSCSTNAPTTPKSPTTQPPAPTMYLGDKINPRIVTTNVPATTGSTLVPAKVGVYATIGGGVGLLLVILVLVVCLCWFKKYRSKPKRRTTEQEYADIDEMMMLRNQGSMMRSNQQLDSNGSHLPRGHRTFNNEMYGLQVMSNGSTPAQQPPTLPGNHPPPSNATPPATAYQPLNLARPGSATAGGGDGEGQACPHCHHPAPNRSATAPHLLSEKPGGQPDGGARSPYMPLLKNNTCPTPATPQEEPICRCHARPLSECSSVPDSLASDRRAGAAPTAPDDSRPLSDASDAHESPYYFKMEQQPQPEAVPSPTSPTPQYFKLEEAQTLPLDTEISPLLADPDSNGNSVLIKPVANGQETVEPDAATKQTGPSKVPCEPADFVMTPSRTLSLSADTMQVNPGGKHTTV